MFKEIVDKQKEIEAQVEKIRLEHSLDRLDFDEASFGANMLHSSVYHSRWRGEPEVQMACSSSSIKDMSTVDFLEYKKAFETEKRLLTNLANKWYEEVVGDLEEELNKEPEEEVNESEE